MKSKTVVQTKVKICKKHGWQKWHPDEECLICRYVEWYGQVYERRPDWKESGNPAFENWINKGHSLGDLPRRQWTREAKRQL